MTVRLASPPPHLTYRNEGDGKKKNRIKSGRKRKKKTFVIYYNTKQL